MQKAKAECLKRDYCKVLPIERSTLSEGLIFYLAKLRVAALIMQAEPFRGKIKSVGLDSTEMEWPPQMFQESYRLAAEQGYRLTAHAGM